MAAVVAICALASCAAGGAGGPPPGEEAVAQGGVTISEVTARPQRYLGERVTVTGTIREVVGPDALTIVGGSVAGEPLLILRKSGVSSGSWQDDEDLTPEVVVRATGTVRRFDGSGIGRQLGCAPEKALSEDHDGEATIVASRVAPVRTDRTS